MLTLCYDRPSGILTITSQCWLAKKALGHAFYPHLPASPIMTAAPATALVLGGDVNGLGVARSLGGAGVPLLLVDTDLSRPTMRTRYGRKMKAPALSGDA